VREEQVLELAWVDVLAASDDHVLQPTLDRAVAPLVHRREIAHSLERRRRAYQTPGLAGLPGDCRTHRAAVLIRSGAWAEGAVEAERAVEEAATFDLTHLGIAFSELAEIRLRQGDFDAAEEALLRAREFGDSGVEPCLTPLRLARGDVSGAGLGVDAALAAAGGRLQRARLLPRKVEASLLAGNPEAAAAAATELEETAASYGSPTLLAAAKHALGAVALATGAKEQAVAHLVAAPQLWQKTHAPYERAQARALLAEAHLGIGDRESSRVEQSAAHATFKRLGAEPAATASARRLQEFV